jgi:hypothetical protein
MIRLIQFLDPAGSRRVGLVEGDTVWELPAWSSTYALAQAAAASGTSLVDLLAQAGRGPAHVFDTLLTERRVLLPFDHPDPAHCFVTGTGLTHLGSAQTRDAMHAKIAGDEATLTDSMRIFRWGIEGGKPADGSPPVQPEWFYKGDGSWLVPPGAPLVRPAFANDGGEEAELVGLYYIANDGTPCRIGFALGNEYSDHVMERKNYLYLAHSKLRTSSFGPELLIGELPSAISGTARLFRAGSEVWSGAFHTGEDNMSYRLAGLEHHHFKYAGFRRPGDVHCHFFGTSLLSFAAGVQARDGDVFEIAAAPFSRPLRNPLSCVSTPAPAVRIL